VAVEYPPKQHLTRDLRMSIERGADGGRAILPIVPEILGEAAKGVPEDVRARHQEVDWRAIAGLRDVLAHAYYALDDATLWDIIQSKVPRLLDHLDRIGEGRQ